MIEFLTDPIVVTVTINDCWSRNCIELFSSKFGVAGFIGMFAFILFFYGHFQAGLAGYGTLLLFVAGIILIFLNFFTRSNFWNTWSGSINS